jgi:hypothetical protein
MKSKLVPDDYVFEDDTEKDIMLYNTKMIIKTYHLNSEQYTNLSCCIFYSITEHYFGSFMITIFMKCFNFHTLYMYMNVV